MSRTSLIERNKAIRKAWEREQSLIKEGKGTRDWTKEQQKDILDPDKGKAYDDQGRAFEGQHMKSAAEYPEYQGNPDNIQFLTRDEHLKAHKGNWKNPTNGYYDHVNDIMIEFEKNQLIPCKVIELRDPIVCKPVSQQDSKADRCLPQKKNLIEDSAKHKGKYVTKHEFEGYYAFAKQPRVQKNKVSKVGYFFRAAKKGIKNYVKQNPLGAFETLGTILTSCSNLYLGYIGHKKNRDNYNFNGINSISRKGKHTNLQNDNLFNNQYKSSNVNGNSNLKKNMDEQQIVKAHQQRYGKEKIWKDKATYKRGGKK